MRKFLIISTLTIILGVTAQAADIKDPQEQADTIACPEGKCDDFQNRRSNGPVPYDDETICSRFDQGHQAQMMVRFFDEKGNELDAKDRHHTKSAEAVGTICPGRHWFEKARRGYVEFCNEDNHTAVLHPPQIEVCLKQGDCTPLPTQYVCLLGEEACKKRLTPASLLE